VVLDAYQGLVLNDVQDVSASTSETNGRLWRLGLSREWREWDGSRGSSKRATTRAKFVQQVFDLCLITDKSCHGDILYIQALGAWLYDNRFGYGPS